jgi:hypothetical protein
MSSKSTPPFATPDSTPNSQPIASGPPPPSTNAVVIRIPSVSRDGGGLVALRELGALGSEDGQVSVKDGL